MTKIYECCDSFSIPKYDAERFIIGQINIEQGERYICDADISGNTVWIENQSKCVEITKEQLRGYFVEVEK